MIDLFASLIIYQHMHKLFKIQSHLWLDLTKSGFHAQELKSNLWPNVKATLQHYPRSTRTNDGAIDGQVCFHGGSFDDPVKPRRSTTGSMGPLMGTNKAAWDVKLLLVTVSAYQVDCGCFCAILNTQHCCLSPCGWYCPPSASHPPPTPAHPL